VCRWVTTDGANALGIGTISSERDLPEGRLTQVFGISALETKFFIPTALIPKIL